LHRGQDRKRAKARSPRTISYKLIELKVTCWPIEFTRRVQSFAVSQVSLESVLAMVR
jgi:hypothetical protein